MPGLRCGCNTTNTHRLGRTRDYCGATTGLLWDYSMAPVSRQSHTTHATITRLLRNKTASLRECGTTTGLLRDWSATTARMIATNEMLDPCETTAGLLRGYSGTTRKPLLVYLARARNTRQDCVAGMVCVAGVHRWVQNNCVLRNGCNQGRASYSRG